MLPTPLHHGHEPWPLCPPRVCILGHEHPPLPPTHTPDEQPVLLCRPRDCTLLLRHQPPSESVLHRPFINELVIFTVGGLMGLVCVLCLVISYAYTFSTMLKIPSAQGKRKAFSTCSSRLSVVYLHFGSSFCVYFSPLSNHLAQKGAVASVMYTVVTPMLNPFIYSWRNRDIKSSLKKLMWARKSHSP